MMDSVLAAPGTLVVVGGRTGSGKSMFGLKLLETVDMPGLFVSLEDPLEVVGMRVRRMDPARRDAVYASRPRARLADVLDSVKESYDALICPKLVVVDYIQILTDGGNGQTRTDEIGEIISELKYLGTQLGFVTVLNSQLKRPQGEDREAQRPTRWDLRDSSNLENAAEAVVLLHPTPGNPRLVEAWVDKNKVGPSRRDRPVSFERGAGGYLCEVEQREGHECQMPF